MSETSSTRSDPHAAIKAFATLRFVGDGLDPDTLSRILNVKATKAHKKGEAFAPGPRSPTKPARTGIWYISTDQFIPGQNLSHHIGFVLALLMPAPGDVSRLVRIRRLIKTKALEAHVTVFWHGPPGARKPTIPAVVSEFFNLIPADVQHDFDSDELRSRVA